MKKNGQYNLFYGAEVVGVALANLKAAIDLTSEALGPVMKMVGDIDVNGHDINELLAKMGEVLPFGLKQRPEPKTEPEPEPDPEPQTLPAPVNQVPEPIIFEEVKEAVKEKRAKNRYPVGRKASKYDRLYRHMDNMKPGKWSRLGPQPEGSPFHVLDAYYAMLKAHGGVGPFRDDGKRFTVHWKMPLEEGANYIDFIKIEMND